MIQSKDVAAAAGKKPSRGICGGNTKDVHDPKKAPSSLLPQSFENESKQLDNPVTDPQELQESNDYSELHSPNQSKSRLPSNQDRITRS